MPPKKKKNMAIAHANRWPSKSESEEDDNDEEENLPRKSERHATAGRRSAESAQIDRETRKDAGVRLLASRKKLSEEKTAAEEAEGAIESLQQAHEVEGELLEDGDEHFGTYEAVMREAGAEESELVLLRKENEELRDKGRLLNNQKKALNKRMKILVENEKKKNKNMQKKLQRKVENPRKAKKRYTELQSRTSRLEAVAKFITLLAGIFTCYTNDDFWAISRKAWPDKFINSIILSPPETWQFMCFINVSFTKMRAIRKYLKKFKLNIFSSEASIYSLIRSAAHRTITMVYNLDVKGIVTRLRCSQVQSLRDVLKQRVAAQIRGGRFPKNLKILQLCIGFDKGGTTTKMGLMMGSIRKRNGPRGMSLLALYEGNESPEELKAAFGSIIEECKNIKMIQIGDRKIYVQFRFTGDLKCLKACLGLKAGSAKYPCLYCMQQKERNFGTYSGAGEKREHFHMNIGTSTGQGHEGCLSWISPNQIVVPSLHLLMGVAESLFDHLTSRIIVRKAIGDFSVPDFSELRDRNENVIKAREELEDERKHLNEWNLIAEKLRSAVLPLPESRYPDGIDEANADYWPGDICGCSACIAEITDLVIPHRHSATITAPVPDWIKSEDRQMWYHSICLGLTADESLIAADIEHYNPQMATFERITNQINIEIEWTERRVKDAEQKLDGALSKLNLPKEVTDLPAINSFFKVFESFGAYRSLWFQRFTGNHIRLILKSMTPTEKRPYTLKTKMLEEDELKGLLQRDGPDFDEQFSQGFEALKVLGDIQSLFASKVLTDTEILQLKSNIMLLKNIMIELKSVKVSHKFHILLEHVAEVAERDKTVGFFSEHGLESLHAHVNALLKRLTVRKNEHKLERILQLVNAATVNRDEHGDLLEEDEESDENFPFPEDDDLLETSVADEQIIFIDLDEEVI